MCCFHLLVFNSLTKLWREYLSLYCLIWKLNHMVLSFKRSDFGRTFGKISVSPNTLITCTFCDSNSTHALLFQGQSNIYMGLFISWHFTKGKLELFTLAVMGSERNNKMQRGIRRFSTNSRDTKDSIHKGVFSLQKNYVPFELGQLGPRKSRI